MAFAGFFSRDDIKKSKTNRPKLRPETSPERFHQLGLRGVQSMNPQSRHPNMKPSGVSDPLVYILGEAPGEDEDNIGKPFVGRAGKVLREHLPVGYMKIVRISNCVRTRPPNNRQPTSAEIECFRPSLCEDIEKTKPKAILGVGFIPLTWALGYDTPNITLARGRRFPVKIGSHRCWFYPTFHPMYIGRIRDSRELIDDVPGSEYERVFHSDIKQCFEEAYRLDPPKVCSPKKAHKGIVCLDGSGAKDLGRIQIFFSLIIADKAFFCVDLETNRVRPYQLGAKILTASVTSGSDTISFAIDHPEAKWSRKDKISLIRIWEELLYSKCERVAHNAPFEIEWTVKKHGHRCMMGGKWHCTAAQAYILDERSGQRKGQGTQNLNFLGQQNLGIRIKDLTNLDKSNLENEDLNKVLLYGGMDTKYDLKLYHAQSARIEEEDLDDIYEKQIARMSSFAFAQVQGLPIRVDAVHRLQQKLSGRSKRLETKIAGQPVVKKYLRRFGEFSPTKPDNVARLFRDMLGRSEGKRGTKYSTDEEALKQMSDVPLADLILRLRGVNKLKSTYVDPLDVTAKKTVVYPDGLLHCQLNPTRTATGRSSIDDPSLQNFPVREAPWIRKVIGTVQNKNPRHDELMLSFDFGAIQARCIAMESGDEVLSKAFWTDFDIHQVWAEKIAKQSPRSYREIGKKDIKNFRQIVKNKMVFPAFFGSSERSIANDLILEDRASHSLFEEFWDEFKGVKRWHKKTFRFYDQHGYVQSLSGRRRRAPMSKSMICNSPIQSDEAEIVCESMNRLLSLALETDRHWLAARLNVHDDLTFITPKRKFDEAVQTIVPIMCDQVFPWMTVPIVIEGSVGKDWYQVKKTPFAKFKTDELDEQLLQFKNRDKV